MATDEAQGEDQSKTTPEPPSTPSTPMTTWKLPDGIEDHIEAGLIKTAIGAAAGGAIGLILFRSGGGMRATSLATGVGVALGSTYERFMADYNKD